MTRLAETRAMLADLVAFPTVSTDSNLAMMAYLAERLEDAGAQVEILHDESGSKANLWATIGPDAPGGIVLSGHSDVVPVTDQDWTSNPFQLREEDGLMYGRGSCDMKGFIAAALATAPDLGARDLSRPVHFAFTHDEEVGCLGAQALVAELKSRGVRPAMAIIGEPTGMQVIEGHKGCCEYTTRFTGLEGHGSAPERGVNAAEFAVRYVANLLALREEMMTRAPANSRYDPPWTTLNIGAIRGGVAHNVIAGKAEVDWEFRPVQASDFVHVKSRVAEYVDDVLLPQMRAVYAGATIETEVIGEIAGLDVLDENAARDLCAALLGANDVDVVPFGTEAGLLAGLGLSAVVCGPGSIDQAHKPDEFLSVGQLGQCLAMLDGLAEKLATR